MKKTILFGIFVFWLIMKPIDSATPVVLWVSDSQNNVAENSIQKSFDYVRNTQSASKITDVIVERIIFNSKEKTISVAQTVCSKLNEMIESGNSPDFMFDSATSLGATQIVRSLSRTLGIPTISLSDYDFTEKMNWDNLTPDEMKYLVQVKTPGYMIPKVIRSIAYNHASTRAGIIYDDNFSLLEEQSVSLFESLPTSQLFRKLPDTQNDITSLMKHFEKLDTSVFFVLASRNNLTEIMSVAKKLLMYGKDYTWYLLSKETDKDFVCDCHGIDVVYVNPYPSSKNSMNQIGLGGTEPEIEAAFFFDIAARAAIGVGLAKEVGTWITPRYTSCNEYTGDAPILRNDVNLKEAIKQANVPNTYGPLMFTDNGQYFMGFNLNIDHLEFSKKLVSTVVNIGSWSAGFPGKINYEDGQTLKKETDNLVYKVVVVVQPPFIVKEVDSDTGSVVYSGLCIDLIEEVRDKIKNFNYEIVESPDGFYGMIDENDEWNGMIREIVKKDADIALGALHMSVEREFAVDFTVPFYDMVGFAIMLVKPQKKTILFRFMTFVDSFVWILLLLTYIFASVLLWIFDRFSPFSYQNNMELFKDDSEKRLFTLKECFWYCFTTVVPQGGGEGPKNRSGAIWSGVWWLFGFIIVTIYMANFAAFLTVDRIDRTVKTFDELFKHYKLSFSTVNNSAAMHYFSNMRYVENQLLEIWKDMAINDEISLYEQSKTAVWNDPIGDKSENIWYAMVDTKFPSTFDEAVARVRASPDVDDGYALIEDASLLRYLVMTNCDLQLIGEEFSPRPYAIAFQKKSPIFERFNEALKDLVNNKRIDELKEKWWTENKNRVNCPVDQGAATTMENIGGVFIVLLAGLVISFVLLIVEFYMNKKEVDEKRQQELHKKTRAELNKKFVQTRKEIY